jgi:hypothetical protein
LLNSLLLSWGSTAPTGLRAPDYWAARFSFVLLAPVSGNYTLAVTVDDIAELHVNGEVLLAAGGSRRTVVWLERGYHDVMVHFLEVTGSASLRLTWDGGVPNTVGAAGDSLLHMCECRAARQQTTQQSATSPCVNCRPWSPSRPATSSWFGQVRLSLCKLSSMERQRGWPAAAPP